MRVAQITPLPLSDNRLETLMTALIGRWVRLRNYNVTTAVVAQLIMGNDHYY